MVKKVELSTGRTFDTIAAAKDHFSVLLERQSPDEPFDGSDFEDIKAVYLAYCATTNWPLPSSPESFSATSDRGPGYTTRCFGVTFPGGKSETFSMLKALSAIAK